MDKLQIKQNTGLQIARPKGSLVDGLGFAGRFDVLHFRGKDLIGEYVAHNAVTNAGKNNILSVQFNAGTQITAWYVGLINSGATVAAGDTSSSHSGWTEFTTYSETVLQAWDEAAPVSQSITSSTTSDFSITGSGTLYGIFVNSASTKPMVSGTLWSTAPFAAGNVTVANGDSLKITYTVSIA